MDPLLWLAAAAVVAAIIFAFPYIRNLFGGKEKLQPRVVEQDERQRERVPVVAGARRPRNMRARAARARARAAAEEDGVEFEPGEMSDEEEEDPVLEGLTQRGVGKIGTKKMRKLQAKAEKKALREQEEAAREESKRRKAIKEEEMNKREKEDLLKQKEEEEAQRKLQELKEQKEHEQYLEMKKAFVVEEEGQDVEDNSEQTLQEFISYIKKNKVVYLEELASQFNMRTQDAISRVQTLQEDGVITGVIDDRGKFIYISMEELEAVAKFIKQRGRVSIAELVSSSNTLINLQPEVEA